MHSGFAAVSELLAARNEFETWSQFVLEELAARNLLETSDVRR
jgi:hypothetical protein